MFKLSKLLEIVFAACLYYSGLVMLARWWTQRSGQKLVILCYHRASAKNLRNQMLYLRRAYRVLHLDAALTELYQPRKHETQRAARRTLLALTFDDGYQDNYTYAATFARGLRTPITIFLIPDYIEHRRPFAWLAGENDHLVPYAQANKATIDGRIYLLDQLDDRQALKHEIDTRVRFTTSIAKRDQFLTCIREALAVPSTLTSTEKLDLPLTLQEIQEMDRNNWVSFGAHTVHHPILTCLTDPAEAHFEVSESRKMLEKILGHPVRTFAYPYGKPEQVGEIGPQAVQAADYTWAVTTIHGFNTPQTDRHRLHRFVVDADDHWLVLAAKASGLWDACLNPVRGSMQFVANAFGLNPPYNPYN
jgi:peptidoglycan/xylan/chitin deacetylase (PgdA/CDA1 family)